MKKVTFIIGKGFEKDGTPIVPHIQENRTKQTFKAVAKAFGGYTATHCFGGWIDDKGELVEETSLKIECLTDIPNVQSISETLAFSFAALWNQDCVVLEISNTEYSFISQKV